MLTLSAKRKDRKAAAVSGKLIPYKKTDNFLVLPGCAETNVNTTSTNPYLAKGQEHI